MDSDWNQIVLIKFIHLTYIVLFGRGNGSLIFDKNVIFLSEGSGRLEKNRKKGPESHKKWLLVL